MSGPILYPHLEASNMSNIRPPKPSELRQPCLDGPFFPIPRGKMSGITRSVAEAQWAITGVIGGSPFVECQTWGGALLLYMKAYTRGEARVLSGVLSGLKRDREECPTTTDETNTEDSLEKRARLLGSVKEESDSDEDLHGEDFGDSMSPCDNDEGHELNEGDEGDELNEGDEGDELNEGHEDDEGDERHDPCDSRSIVFGPPDPHPQYIVVTEDSLGCICGCQRTVESVEAEKRARRKERRDVRDAAIRDAATAIATTNISITLMFHLAPGVNPTHMTIAPVIHLPSHLSPGAPVHIEVAALSPTATVVVPATAVPVPADIVSTAPPPSVDTAPMPSVVTAITHPLGPELGSMVPLWGTVSGWPEDDMEPIL